MFDSLLRPQSRSKPKPVQELDFHYEIVRSQRKTAAIHVKNQKVEIRIPFAVDDAWAHDFAYEKRQWISAKLKSMAVRSEELPSLDWHSPLLWMGDYKLLAYYPARKNKVCIDGQEIQIHGPKQPSIDQLKKLLADFFKRQAKVYLTTRTLEISERIGLQYKLNGIGFRRTKSKWGHCTNKGDIQYNWLIMGAPPAIIDYLIYHELTHLLHHNHSKAYWAQLKQFFPDYLSGQKWLKANGHRLSWY